MEIDNWHDGSLNRQRIRGRWRVDAPKQRVGDLMKSVWIVYCLLVLCSYYTNNDLKLYRLGLRLLRGKEKNILLPPLCIELGLMKQFIKALSKEAEGFRYLCRQFPGLSVAKLKEEIFVRPDIRKRWRKIQTLRGHNGNRRKGSVNIF